MGEPFLWGPGDKCALSKGWRLVIANTMTEEVALLPCQREVSGQWRVKSSANAELENKFANRSAGVGLQHFDDFGSFHLVNLVVKLCKVLFEPGVELGIQGQRIISVQ